MKIKKGDRVKIIKGRDRGKRGKVIQLLPAERKIVVEGLNLLVKHVRPRRQGEKGQRVQFNVPLHSSKIMLICPKCNKQTRVGFKYLKTPDQKKKKVRRCKKCQEIID
jgi:large subunit ribosomal protein L24